MKKLTSTQQIREAISNFRGREFYLIELKHIYSYASRIENLLSMGEVEELEQINGKRVFKATDKLRPWDYQHASHTNRKYKSRAFHKALKNEIPVITKPIECAGWRDVTPFLFSDPYYKINGKVTIVSGM